MNTNWKRVDIPKDAFLSLLNNEFISDVKFRFADGRTLYAHSFVLCCRSCEYYNSFVANIGVSKVIEVCDFTYDEFYEFLAHLYTNACQVDKVTASGVMKLSKQHALSELETQCADAILKEIDVSNAFAILETSIESEFEEVTKRATDFIAGNYFAALSQDSFLKVNNRTLRLVLELEPVSDVDEFKVFERVMKWAAQACLTEVTETSICTNKNRAKLGKNFKLIRFGAMSAAEFTTCQQLEPGLLEDKEVISIYQSIATSEVNQLGFLNNKRIQKDLTMLDSVEFYDCANVKHAVGKQLWFYFRVSHCIQIKQIELFQMDNIEEFKLTYGNEIIHKSSGPFTGLLNPKPKLQPNKQYYVFVQYSTEINKTYIGSSKCRSKSGRCEFQLLPDSKYNFYKCIKKLIFLI